MASIPLFFQLWSSIWVGTNTRMIANTSPAESMSPLMVSEIVLESFSILIIDCEFSRQICRKKMAINFFSWDWGDIFHVEMKIERRVEYFQWLIIQHEINGINEAERWAVSVCVVCWTEDSMRWLSVRFKHFRPETVGWLLADMWLWFCQSDWPVAGLVTDDLVFSMVLNVWNHLLVTRKCLCLLLQEINWLTCQQRDRHIDRHTHTRTNIHIDR